MVRGKWADEMVSGRQRPVYDGLDLSRDTQRFAISGVWGMFLSWIDFFFVSRHDHGHGIYLFLLTTVHILGRENGKVLNT